MNDLETRVEKLETLLLPPKDYSSDIYDFLIQAEQATAACTEAEAILLYGDKETFVNEWRVD
jgi:hypothetical protein